MCIRDSLSIRRCSSVGGVTSKKQRIRSKQCGKITNARRASRGVYNAQARPHSTVNPCARPRSAIPLRAGNPTHRVWLLVVAAFYVRGERELRASKNTPKHTHAHTKKSLGECPRDLPRGPLRQSRAAVCFQGGAGRYSPMCLLGHETQLLSTPTPNAEKSWCFWRKKVASEICVSWCGPTQTQLLTQLSPKHNF